MKHECEFFGFAWSDENVNGLFPKSKGKGMNASDFIMAWDGVLRDNQGNKARRITKIGGDTARGEKYWNVHDMADQLIDAVIIFENKFKLNAERRRSLVIPVFNFDHAPSYTARPENALNACKMNVNPGVHTLLFFCLQFFLFVL